MTQGSKNGLQILTPSPSSAFLTVLVHAISTHSQRNIHITSLFADPNDPSTPTPLHTLSSSSQSRIHTTHLPFSNLGSACQDVDVLLLEADSVDTQGNVRSAVGALAAAVCVKTLARDAVVVGLVSRDVDAYITELGPLAMSDMSRLAREIGELERHIFGEGEE
jgi:translation initiation factor 2B subunit (eIF-2B alpha/beta/delta family)